MKRVGFDNYDEQSMIGKVKQYSKDKKMWKHISFHLIKFPITVITFSLCMFLVFLPISLIVSPLIYKYFTYNFLFFKVTNIYQAGVLFLCGLLLGKISSVVLNKMAMKQGLLLKRLVR